MFELIDHDQEFATSSLIANGAVALAIPLEEAEGICSLLALENYRPMDIDVYMMEGRRFAGLVWRTDGEQRRIHFDMSKETLFERIERLRLEDFHLQEIASYNVNKVEHGQLRYIGIWQKGGQETRLLPNLPEEEMVVERRKLEQEEEYDVVISLDVATHVFPPEWAEVRVKNSRYMSWFTTIDMPSEPRLGLAPVSIESYPRLPSSMTAARKLKLALDYASKHRATHLPLEAMCHYFMGDTEQCLEILSESESIPWSTEIRELYFLSLMELGNEEKAQSELDLLESNYKSDCRAELVKLIPESLGLSPQQLKGRIAEVLEKNAVKGWDAIRAAQLVGYLAWRKRDNTELVNYFSQLAVDILRTESARGNTHDYILTDLSLYAFCECESFREYVESLRDSVGYSVVFFAQPEDLTTFDEGESHDDLFETLQDRMLDHAWLPTSLAITTLSQTSTHRLAIVGQKPIRTHEIERKYSLTRQCNAAVALLALGRGEVVADWINQVRQDPLLCRDVCAEVEEKRDDTIIFLLAQHLAACRAPSTLMEGLLDQSSYAPLRWSAALAIGISCLQDDGPSHQQVMIPTLKTIVKREESYHIRVAANWALERLGESRDLDVTTEDSVVLDRDRDGVVGDSVDPLGNRWVSLRGRLVFHCGSSSRAYTKDKYMSLHHRAFPNGVSVLDSKVTADQLTEFGFAHAESGSLPASVSFDVAAQFCNAYSEALGLDEDQWCYIASEETGRLEAAPNILDRVGCRLPTEAEWEMFCRSESHTDTFFGTADSSSFWQGSNPVRTAPPNQYGLFDLFCGGGELCHGMKDAPIKPQSPEKMYYNEAGRYLVRRGLYRPSRCASRDETMRDKPAGFRLVRTSPNANAN